ERQLDQIIGTPATPASGQAPPASTTATTTTAAAPAATEDAAPPIVLARASPPSSPQQRPVEQFGDFVPGPGFVLVRTDVGELDFGMTTYARFQDQSGYAATSTDAFGRERDVLRQNNILLAKGQLNFRGWIFDPRLN